MSCQKERGQRSPSSAPKLVTCKNQSHDIQLPKETENHPFEADLAVGSLDAVELAASLGSAGGDPERREERKAADCRVEGSATKTENGDRGLSSLTWVDNAPKTDSPAPGRSGEDGACHVSRDPCVDLRESISSQKVCCGAMKTCFGASGGSQLERRGARTHQEGKGRDVGEEEA
jgi:hypothetical protein